MLAPPSAAPSPTPGPVRALALLIGLVLGTGLVAVGATHAVTPVGAHPLEQAAFDPAEPVQLPSGGRGLGPAVDAVLQHGVDALAAARTDLLAAQAERDAAALAASETEAALAEPAVTAPPATTAPTEPPPPAAPTSPPPPPPTTAPPAPAEPASPPPSGLVRDAAAEATVHAYLNQRRAEHGLPALPRVDCVDALASDWAQHQARTGSMAHRPGLAEAYTSFCGPSWRIVGENVGHANTAERLNELWWESSSHRSNMLGGFDRVGIGVWRDATGHLWAAVNFAA
jgi:uncharacterized protein YkwD